MTDYKKIHGYNVRDYTTDPSNILTGQVWFDKTNIAVQFQAEGAGAWSTGTAYNNARKGATSAGNRTSALIAGGGTGGTSGDDHSAQTETWNGTSWTEVADLNQRRNSNTGVGADSTQALSLGGGAPGIPIGDNAGVLVESWNGSSWTELADLSQNKGEAATIGEYEDALCVGGNNPGIAQNEKWNGSSWTELADLNQGRGNAIGTGTTSTSGIVSGGFISPSPGSLWTDKVETWNGSSWTEVNDLNTGRAGLGGGGSATATVVFGGRYDGNPNVNHTETWNGTSWTEVNNLSTAREKPFYSQHGSSTQNMAIGGAEGPLDEMITTVEDWDDPTLSVKTVSTD